MQEKNSNIKEYEVETENAGLTLEAYVKDILHVSARNRQRLFFHKQVYLNGRVAHSQKVVKAGDCVGVRMLQDTSYGVVPEKGTIDVLYEDADVIVLNKPAGILVHPAGQTTSGTLANYLAGYFKEQGTVVTVRPLHRLDRDTSGCVLFAKSAKAQQVLEQALAKGEVKRRYEAMVEGSAEALMQRYPEGRINLPIGRDPLRPNRRRVTPKGQPAVTNFTIAGSFAKFLLLELELETGRTHQIRVHLSYSGFPVVGDKMYGRSSRLIKRQALHAFALAFVHPVSGEQIAVTAPRPLDFVQLLQAEKV